MEVKLSYQTNLRKYLGKTFEYFKPKNIHSNNCLALPKERCHTSNFTVYDLLERTLSDKEFQLQILNKLKEYTSETTEYLSGEQLKPNRFYLILIKLESFMKEEEGNLLKDFSKSFVVDFEFHQKHYEISQISVNCLEKHNDKVMAGVTSSLYDYCQIIFNSVVNENAIKRFGEAGFVAMLLIFMKEDVLCKPEDTLINTVATTIASKLNELYDNEEYNELAMYLSYTPKFFCGKWYFRKALNEQLQYYLFSEYDNGQGDCIKIDPKTKTITSRRWYVIVNGKEYDTKIECIKEGKTRTWIYDRNLEIVDIVEST